MHQSYVESYMAMVKEGNFTELDSPLVYAGYRMALALDEQTTPSTSLWTEYSRTCRHLIAGKGNQSIADELSDFLRLNMS